MLLFSIQKNKQTCDLILKKVPRPLHSYSLWKERWHLSKSFQYSWKDYMESHRNILLLFLCSTSCIYCQLKSPIPSISPKSFHLPGQLQWRAPLCPCSLSFCFISCPSFLLSSHTIFLQTPDLSPSCPSCCPVSLPTQDTLPISDLSSLHLPVTPSHIYSGFNHSFCLPCLPFEL